MRWNLSSRARELSGGDAILISIPKSGRTWIRTFLNAYFSYKVGRQFSLDLTELGDRSDFTIVRYEDLRAEPARLFHELLRAIGEKEIDNAVFGPAIDFSDFRNMQKLEMAGGFGSKILQPRDPEDSESFKVRQGKIGSFRQYLSAESQRYAEEICAALNPVFGYPIKRMVEHENRINPTSVE